ncbi:MAG: hypothetical protein ACM34I_10460 [bacterium]
MNRQDSLAKAELSKSKKTAAGLIADRFPGVADMVIHMTYYHEAANPVLMERTINVFPTSFAYFQMECMNRDCTNGGFDLTSVIRNMVKNRKKTHKGTLACKGDNKVLSPEHASISYEITIRYKKKSR